MSIEYLPQEVILQVFQQLPRTVIYQFRKSQDHAIAAAAYSILYENVVLDGTIQQLGSNYTNWFYNPELFHERPLEVISYEDAYEFEERDPTLPPDPLDIPWHVKGAKELVDLCSNPLFHPHTLTYLYNSDLVEVEELAPGLLKRFRYLSYFDSIIFGVLRDEMVLDVSGYKHKVFMVPQSCKRHQIPKSVQTLVHPTVEPMEPMESVNCIVHIGNGTEISSYKRFPNLEQLTLRSTPVPGQLDLPKLTKLTISYGRGADLSNLTALKTASIFLTGGTVGYSHDFKFVLPGNLQELHVSSVMSAEQVVLEQGVSLKKVSITFSEEINVSHVSLPPNVVDLTLRGEEKILESVDQRFPDSVKALALTGFSRLQNPRFPPKLESLNLTNSDTGYMNLSDLVHVKKLSTDTEACTLPPHLESLKYVDYFSDSLLHQLQNVKYSLIRYDGSRQIPDLVIPPSIETLTLERPFLKNVSGGENLTCLALTNYTSLQPISLVKLKNLKSLSLHAHHSSRRFLPLLPSTLEVLVLKEIGPCDFTCPTNLRFLRLDMCDFKDQSVILNDKLLVMSALYTELNFPDLFKSLGKYLEAVELSVCGTGKLEADFSHTSLHRFTMDQCKFWSKEKNTVKFPSCLEFFSTDGARDISELHWADLSLCGPVVDLYARPGCF